MLEKINLIFVIIITCNFFISCKNNIEDNKRKLIPLIESINKYIKDTGKFPKNLSQLTPKYIKELPKISTKYYYKTHGKYYLIYFGYKKNLLHGDWAKYIIYWSKTNKWYKSDFTEWPEE